MPGEKEIIAILNALLPQGRLNRVHESDCEIITLGGKPYLFTTDEFSAEDRFLETNPRVLGWNVASGALSDIYACGGKPLYYAHALTVAQEWDTPFITKFGEGVADALKHSGARFIGGDCGLAAQWRCCVTVIGACEGTPLCRLGAKPGDGIYLSGRIGGGNVQAALGLAPLGTTPASCLADVKLHLRNRESAMIRQFASSCIDTSDGVWKALSIIADLNGCGYALDKLPYHRAGAILSQALALPQIMLLLGECGEYELLCTIPAEREPQFCSEAKSSGLRFFRLGTITDKGSTVTDKKNRYDLSSLHIEARSFVSTREYLSALTTWITAAEVRYAP